MHDLQGGALIRRNIVFGALVALALAYGASFATASSRHADGGSLNGAGSTFVVPLVSKWQGAYKASTINYSGIGSGRGHAPRKAPPPPLRAPAPPPPPHPIS